MRSRKIVLVVDDDDDLREVLAEVLADEAYAVQQAADGVGAIDFLLDCVEEPPEMVLLDDVRLPASVSPQDVRDFIATADHLRDVRVVPLTVMSDDAERVVLARINSR